MNAPSNIPLARPFSVPQLAHRWGCSEGLIRKMEALFDGPYAELFSRSSRPGWETFGNEVGKFDGVLV